MCSIWGVFLSFASHDHSLQQCTDEAQNAETVLSAVSYRNLVLGIYEYQECFGKLQFSPLHRNRKRFLIIRNGYELMKTEQRFQYTCENNLTQLLLSLLAYLPKR